MAVSKKSPQNLPTRPPIEGFEGDPRALKNLKQLREGNKEQRESFELTERELLFVRYYVEERMSARAAAQAAGFSTPQAVKILLDRPRVQRAVARKQAEYAAATQVTKRQVIDGVLEAISMAKLKAEPLAMINGWREIGRMCGFYEPVKAQVEVSVNGQVMVQRLSAMSDAELLKLAEGGGAEVIEAEVKELVHAAGE
mgnify:FL=1